MLKTVWSSFFAGFLGVAITISATAEPEAIFFTTDDDIRIAATVDGVTEGDRKQAVVIFIHQGGSSKEEWINTTLYRQVVDAGMIAFTYDVRGHGASGGTADYATLFDDPNQAPRDLLAALDVLKKLPAVDTDKIAIVGSSIGSNLAVMGTALPEYGVRTAVAISGKASAVYNLAATEPGKLPMTSVYHIASEHEQDGLRASWAEELYNVTSGPRRLEVVNGSSAHGVAIFRDDPGLSGRIFDWLRQTLR